MCGHNAFSSGCRGAHLLAVFKWPAQLACSAHEILDSQQVAPQLRTAATPWNAARRLPLSPLSAAPSPLAVLGPEPAPASAALYSLLQIASPRCWVYSWSHGTCFRCFMSCDCTLLRACTQAALSMLHCTCGNAANVPAEAEAWVAGRPSTRRAFCLLLRSLATAGALCCRSRTMLNVVNIAAK